MGMVQFWMRRSRRSPGALWPFDAYIILCKYVCVRQSLLYPAVCGVRRCVEVAGEEAVSGASAHEHCEYECVAVYRDSPPAALPLARLRKVHAGARERSRSSHHKPSLARCTEAVPAVCLICRDLCDSNVVPRTRRLPSGCAARGPRRWFDRRQAPRFWAAGLLRPLAVFFTLISANYNMSVCV